MHRISTVLLIASIPLMAHAQAGEWGSRGNSMRFAVDGRYVIAADGRGAAVYDVSQSPVRRAAVAQTDSESLDVAVIDANQVAVATREALVRFRIASDGSLTELGRDPDAVATRIASNGTDLAGVTPLGIAVWNAATMDVVRRFATPQPPAALAWHGDTLIAAVPATGLYFFDVNGSGDSTLIPEDARDVVVRGDTAWVAAGPHGLVRVDLGGSSPVERGNFGTGMVNFDAVVASNGRLYAVEQPDHITVFDLTSGTPVAAASFEEPVQAIAASGTSLFVSGAVFDSHGVAGNSGTPLRVFDLSDPASPHLASEFQDLAGPVSGVATDGSLAWVADRPFFRIFDVSTTASPREVSSLRIDDMGDRVLVQGTRAIVYGRGDVHLIDISNPYAPHLLKVFVSHGGPPSGAAFARTTIIEGNGYSGFHVLDFDREGDPLQIGGLKGHYSDAAADGDTAWVTYFGSTTVAVDLSDPTNPRPVSQLPLGGVRSLVVPATAAHPELLFVQALDGVHLLSLANKLHPVETAYIPSSDITAIAADGDTGYVAGSGFVRRLDLAGFGTAPAAMHVVAPMQMAAAAGKVVIADRYSLRVYGPDTAPPPPPTFRRHAASR